ncbi:ribosome hibernation-promoting factor, HPF/YfiA family [Kordiimonas sp.]|uniref:ribosome hibernation-promoting factor, HPF/YfiA family n=1 Tax=Kordiimonas sp. TaxID=1970157 RepID=UPI003A8DC8AC|eukprot:TRINITY_DN1707_c0_g1_i5.p1 TRINITY_DN1707_c0_g1~~TRINITY_DN1707_c0_g1_i5.p1  ORF type:complete len:194 (-),score=11.29 TRINITY_DN1707_c0_g1_i5:70-651(-)
MDINVTGRKMNVGAALTSHVEERLEAVAEKYFSRTIDSTTTFVKEGHLYRVDISLHANQGISLQARGEADEPYVAFENATEKIEKQLRRYKRRLKNHHHAPQRDVALELARDTVIAPETEDDTEALNGADDQPIIIAESKKEIPLVSVGDAVMLMDLADANAFVFRNRKSETLEVVYRRQDGNIGWISPGTAA